MRLDNLIYLFNSIFDAARWPASVFRGVWRVLFTFVMPLALMTTYPALALLGRLEAGTAVRALGGAALFVLVGARGVAAIDRTLSLGVVVGYNGRVDRDRRLICKAGAGARRRAGAAGVRQQRQP